MAGQTGQDQPLKARVAGRSSVGLKRSINQDAFRTQIPTAGMGSNVALFVLADGVGGNLPRGEIASRTAVDAMTSSFYAMSDDIDLLMRAHQAVQFANQAVREQAVEVGAFKIGTTLAGFALAPDGQVVVFNVGDSRVYRVRDNAILRISQDQVVPPPTTSGEAEARRSTQIASYLGQDLPLEPFFYKIQARPGDVFCVCSDGVWSVIDDDELRDLIVKHDIDTAANLCVEQVEKRGAPDNLTLVLVEIGERRPRRRASLWLGGIAVIAAAAVIGLLAVQSGLFGGAGGGQDTPTAETTPQASSPSPAASATVGVGIPPQTSTSLPTLPTVDQETPAAVSTVVTAARTVTRAVTRAAPTRTASPAPLIPLQVSTATSTETATDIPTVTPSATATDTSTPTISPTDTAEPSATATKPPPSTSVPTVTPIMPTTTPVFTITREPPTATRTAIPSRTPSPIPSPTDTALPSATHQPYRWVITALPGSIPSSTPSFTASFTPSSTPPRTAPSTLSAAQITMTAHALAATTTRAAAPITATHTPLPTMTPPPTVVFPRLTVTTVRGINLRQGPARVYPVVGTMAVNSTGLITGYASGESGIWYYVQLENGRAGWVASWVDGIAVTGDTSIVPQLVPPPSPTPTLIIISPAVTQETRP